VDQEIRQRVLADPVFRLVRWTAPWVGLGLLLFVLAGLATEFRRGVDTRAATTTGTIDATGSVGATATNAASKTVTPPKPATPQAAPAQSPAPPQTTLGTTKIAIALVEGVLLRDAGSADGNVIDRLANGTEMIVLEESTTWLKVKDPLGRVGWIRNNENLVSLKQKG
jgi:hypothetical protein